MKIEIDRTKLKTHGVDTSDLIGRLSKGKAILFTGAGFSSNAKDINKNEPSLARDLAKAICNLGGFPEDDDLRYATDYYIENFDKNLIIDLLKEKYTLQSTSKNQNDICSINWRRFYTTNYDKGVEMASANMGKVIECVDLSFPTESYYKRDGLCIHLNGSIDSLNEESLENGFKLSTSSYISPDSFINSDWYYYFKKDLERSSAIVFVGYSMYDVEIQKILFENKSLKEKTYFITKENPDQKTNFILSRFGTVIPIGVDGFAKLINENSEIFHGASKEQGLHSLALYEINHEKSEIRDSEIEAMIMYGNIAKKYIDDGITSHQKNPYLIIRKHLETAKEFIDNKNNVIFYGDMGNGKSILLRELQAYLSMSSIESYYIADWEADYIGDIDALARSGKKIVINIDGYEKHIDLIEHFCRSQPKNIHIIATARTAEHERLRHSLKKIDFNYNEVCIDTLNDNELDKLVDIIDNLGMWGDKAGLSKDRKTSFISHSNLSQISLSLLSLFNAPQIRDRISVALANLMSTPEIRDTIFAISLIEILDIPCNFSLISDVAGNDSIYKSKLLQDESFKNLFQVKGLKVETKSSLFCLSLIRNHFPASYVTNQLQKIAKTFNECGQKDYDQRVIFKSTLRFSFIERLISEENKKSNLRRYYEDLKTSVSWLINDPHYWLQYGMSNITFNELQKAQQYLNQSYSLAAKRDKYHTQNIDTQQARLYLLIAINENDGAKIYDLFSKCHTLLERLDNDVYKFRQVEKYREFYDACFSKLSKGNKVNFQRKCQSMKNAINSAVDDGVINIYHQTSVHRSQSNLDYILASIET